LGIINGSIATKRKRGGQLRVAAHERAGGGVGAQAPDVHLVDVGANVQGGDVAEHDGRRGTFPGARKLPDPHVHLQHLPANGALHLQLVEFGANAGDGRLAMVDLGAGDRQVRCPGAGLRTSASCASASASACWRLRRPTRGACVLRG
jgi:hypothetical protein